MEIDLFRRHSGAPYITPYICILCSFDLRVPAAEGGLDQISCDKFSGWG